MKLIEQIRADRMAAFKAKENIKKDILGCLLADSCKEVKEPEDSKVLSVIKKFIENAEFVMSKVDHEDSNYHKASIEIDILKQYQPKQFTEEELKNAITEAIQTNSEYSNLGYIMNYLKSNYAGLYDGKLASKLAKERV